MQPPQATSHKPQATREATLSVVVPCYNEEEVVRATHARLAEVLAGEEFEIVYVNDGSRDATLPILLEIQESDPRVRVVDLSRNFGHQRAVTAGIDYASGRAVVLIDADLQDPPEVILRMLEKWREGYAVVYGQRKERAGEPGWRKTAMKIFYRLMNRMSEISMPLDTGDFRLMDRKVVTALKRMPERDRYIRGMVTWVGHRQCAVEYARAGRFAGQSKYPLPKLIGLALDGLLSFSIKPLRLAVRLGLLTALLGLAGIVYVVIVRLTTTRWVTGWAFLTVTILLLGGVQLVCLGIIGEYVGRIYGETKRRPLYFVEQVYGFEEE